MTTIKKTNQINKSSDVAFILDKWSPKFLKNIDSDLLNYISKLINQNKSNFIAVNHLGQNIFVILPDSKKDLNLSREAIRKYGNVICDKINSAKNQEVTLVNLTQKKQYTLALAEGLALSNYQFIKHKSDKKNLNTLKTVFIIDKNTKEADINYLNIVIDATSKARDLVNEPVNVINSVALADAFKEFGKKAGFKVEVFNKAKIQQLKMGGLLAVNQGSVDPPTFTVMEYKPARPKNKKPYVLVGKGVVYDTGGLSLKPTANSMDLMKCDMAGAAAVGATIYAIAKAKLNVHVIGLVPATDNRPGFNAFAPGDIITMMDGSTVEMLNSDAEGRMILADALHYAKKYSPLLTIDIATLTGAAAVAIGPVGIVGMGTANEQQKNKIKQSGHNVHERIAEFPFWDEYDELIKSDIADLKNLGGPNAGAITAGKFLARFTNYPYFHLDIAGSALLTTKDSYRGKGATGVGVRLLFDFFVNSGK